MSRRVGQNGNVYQPAHLGKWNGQAPCYGRVYVDVQGADRQRKTVALGICRTPSIARNRLREFIEREKINSTQAYQQNTAPAKTFREQSEQWMDSLPKRTRKKVKPATIYSWQHALDRWILPNLGDSLLLDVGNKSLRQMIETMSKANLAPKTIVNVVAVVKMVVASAVTEEGDQIYPRTWNHDFVQLPIVDKDLQSRPTITKDELHTVLRSVKERDAVLFTLVAGTGLRIGECLAIQVSDFEPDCRVLNVNRSIWHGKIQDPKTTNAIRVIDIPEPLAKVLREYVTGKRGYLFQNRKGNPLDQRNLLDALHSTYKGEGGFHMFRRFRAAVIRKASVPEDLIKLWLGHARTLTDRYASQLRDDLTYRQEWCERAGLGFDLGYMGYKDSTQIELEKVA